MASSEGLKKLGELITPLLNNISREVRDNQTAQNQEILLAIGRLEIRMDVFEKLLGEKKKPVARAKASTTPVKAGDAVVVDQPAGVKKNFPVNKMVYFKQQYRESEEFRKEFTTEEVQAALDADEKVQSKKGASKIAAEGALIYNFHRNSEDKTMFDKLGDTYKAAKEQYNSDNKPEQEVAEEVAQ